MLQGLESIYDATSDYSQKKLQRQPSDGTKSRLDTQMQGLTAAILNLRQRLGPRGEQATPSRPSVPQQWRLSTKLSSPSIYYGDKNNLEPFIAQLRLKITVNSD
jgi:hypothetical protein